METSLVNVNFPSVTSPWFSELLPYLQFLKNNQIKIILMPERQILGWQIRSPPH